MLTEGKRNGRLESRCGGLPPARRLAPRAHALLALVSAASQSGYDEQNAVGAWAQITWFGLQVFGFSPPPNDAVAQTAGHPGLMYLPPASPA